jgi:AraC family transcriptional regulator of adaptative response/methylated-DNA-[protein]-cysteine methyltransferase
MFLNFVSLNTDCMTQEQTNYGRIADAIKFLQTHFRQQPELHDVAEEVHLSPFHFQKLFTEWAGVSPKKFLQYISLQHAKEMLKNQASLFDTAEDIGLSGTGRLHDLFISIEGMTPGDYKNGGQALSINYSFADTMFGDIIIASTPKGICHLAFSDNEQQALANLHTAFPNAAFKEMTDLLHQQALHVFKKDWRALNQIKLHLKGTPFQIKVWESLLKIPMGKFTTYGNLAQHLQNPKASRAVGSAIGDNPIAFIIPCHRVIQSTGIFGQYHWGSLRKTAILGWEAAQTENDLP